MVTQKLGKSQSISSISQSSSQAAVEFDVFLGKRLPTAPALADHHLTTGYVFGSFVTKIYI